MLVASSFKNMQDDEYWLEAVDFYFMKPNIH